MRDRLIFALVLLLCLAIIVTYALIGQPEPEPAPLRLPGVRLRPGELLHFEPPPVGTPEANPVLYLHIAPRDEVTRQPITQPVTVLLDGKALGVGRSQYTFELPGAMTEPRELRIEVDGYQPWAVEISYRLTNSRHWDLPVWLKPSTTPVKGGEA